METLFFGLFMLLISFMMYINLPKQQVKKENTFKVDLGNGLEIVTQERLENLSKNEKDYIFSKVNHCTQLTTLPENINWNTTNMTEVMSLNRMNENQRRYCIDNNLIFNTGLGLAAIIEGKDKAMFNAL